MSGLDPSYREELSGDVVDYDYEVGLMESSNAKEHPSIENIVGDDEVGYVKKTTLPTLQAVVVVVATLLFAVCLGIAAGALLNRDGASGVGSVAKDDVSRFDKLEPPTSVTVPRQEPYPSEIPAPSPPRLPDPSEPLPHPEVCDSMASRNIYPATALPEPWKFMPAEGQAWVIGPAELPPVIIESSKIGWWWVEFEQPQTPDGVNYTLCPGMGV